MPPLLPHIAQTDKLYFSPLPHIALTDTLSLPPMQPAGRADYFGALPNLAARLMSLAAPGQVLVHGNLGSMHGMEWASDDHAAAMLHGPAGEVELTQLGYFVVKVGRFVPVLAPLPLALLGLFGWVPATARGGVFRLSLWRGSRMHVGVAAQGGCGIVSGCHLSYPHRRAWLHQSCPRTHPFIHKGTPTPRRHITSLHPRALHHTATPILTHRPIPFPSLSRSQGIEGSRLVYQARLAALAGRHFELHPDAVRLGSQGSTLSRLLSIRMRGSEVDASPRWVVNPAALQALCSQARSTCSTINLLQW